MKDLRPSNGDVSMSVSGVSRFATVRSAAARIAAHAAPRVVVGAGLQDVLLTPALAGCLVVLAEAGVAEEEQVEARAGAARARRQDDAVGRGQRRNGSRDSDGLARSAGATRLASGGRDVAAAPRCRRLAGAPPLPFDGCIMRSNIPHKPMKSFLPQRPVEVTRDWRDQILPGRARAGSDRARRRSCPAAA